MFDEPDVPRAIEDQQFIAAVESAIGNDLRRYGIFAEIMWHLQTPYTFIFKIVVDSALTDLDGLMEALEDQGPDTVELGVSRPYVHEGNLLVNVPRTSKG